MIIRIRIAGYFIYNPDLCRRLLVCCPGTGNTSDRIRDGYLLQHRKLHPATDVWFYEAKLKSIHPLKYFFSCGENYLIHFATLSLTEIIPVPLLIFVTYVFASMLNLLLYFSETCLVISSTESFSIKLIVQPPNPPPIMREP